MMVKITIKETKEVEVKYLSVNAGVRYWDDATINGENDEDGGNVPCKDGDSWKPLIDLETGQVINWDIGKTAEIHFKVCDAGVYTLLDADKNKLKEIDGYVPSIMSPKDRGYGDYIIMDIDENGFIQNFDGTDLGEFEGDTE